MSYSTHARLFYLCTAFFNFESEALLTRLFIKAELDSNKVFIYINLLPHPHIYCNYMLGLKSGHIHLL